MRLLLVFLFLLLAILQYNLWVSPATVPKLWEMERKLEQLEMEKTKLQKRNQALEAEVKNLKESMDAVEERARRDMGLIKEGETFFQVIE